MLVRYGSKHEADQEWVYNEADIDRAKVVWAREMDEPNDRRLLNYFRNRHAWLLEVDGSSPKLSPYTLPSESGR